MQSLPPDPDAEIAQLLRDLETAGKSRDARAEVLGKLVDLLKPELKERASRLLRGERPGHLLQTTALLHEAYMRLVRSRLILADRQVFMAMAYRVMRQILIDHARIGANRVMKEASAAVTALDFQSAQEAAAKDPTALLELDQILSLLPDEQQTVVDLLFFAGLSQEEAADELGVNQETLRRRWYRIRRRLYDLYNERGKGAA